MAATTLAVETQHEDMIHDAQMDYYGKRLATASSDRTIRVFEVTAEQQRLITTLRGHDGPVWQVAWAHPKHGTLLASGSYDGKVIVWKEEQNNWVKVWEYGDHEASVNSVAWAPHTLGLVLAAASADGTVSVHTYVNSAWSSSRFVAHLGGVNAVSWAPEAQKGALLSHDAAAQATVVRRFVTGGCDNRIRIWGFDDQKGIWDEQHVFGAEEKGAEANFHEDWVRDVQWAPSLGLPSNTIASCSEDQKVIIWTEDVHGQWTKADTIAFAQKVWRVSWSIMGNILAVSQGDNKVSLWKETVAGTWTQLATAQDSDSKDNKSQS